MWQGKVGLRGFPHAEGFSGPGLGEGTSGVLEAPGEALDVNVHRGL